LAQAKQTFLNAGYKPAEVNAAVQKISPSAVVAPIGAPIQPATSVASGPPAIASPATLSQQAPAITTQQQQARPSVAQPPKKGLSKIWVIIMIIISLLILIGAAAAGLFWDKLFV